MATDEAVSQGLKTREEERCRRREVGDGQGEVRKGHDDVDVDRQRGRGGSSRLWL